MLHGFIVCLSAKWSGKRRTTNGHMMSNSSCGWKRFRIRYSANNRICPYHLASQTNPWITLQILLVGQFHLKGVNPCPEVINIIGLKIVYTKEIYFKACLPQLPDNLINPIQILIAKIVRIKLRTYMACRRHGISPIPWHWTSPW